MRFTLLGNAVDSLKATYNSLERISELAEGYEHHIKDAILSVNHATELLFKYLLKKQNEYLVFKDLNAYMFAKEKMISDNKNNVFEAKPNLQTIGIGESIRRLELLCNIEVSDELKEKTESLNTKRNEIMHYEIDMSKQEVESLTLEIKEFYELLITYFSKHKQYFPEMVGVARFEFTKEELSEDPDVESMVEESYLEHVEAESLSIPEKE